MVTLTNSKLSPFLVKLFLLCKGINIKLTLTAGDVVLQIFSFKTIRNGFVKFVPAVLTNRNAN